jgi:phenylalanyl-tRNA synthetase beta chain
VRIVLSWLRELCPVDLSAEQLGELLAWQGLHTESIERPWERLSGVVVAKVLEVRDHPNSDKLCLVRVSTGSGERELVAGVRNMKAGDLVPLAGPGASVPALPEPLSAREIRGVVSEGMLCSPRELALSADHSGILILTDQVDVGADFRSAYGLDEVVLDLEVEANRPDELSVLGVAREVSAVTGVPVVPPELSVKESKEAASKAASVDVLDQERCPRYLARVITDVAVGPSPLKVQARLFASGMRPLSNVVDATNYVMLELGQPMHPFDLAKLGGRAIVVRRAQEGERLVTLDDVERSLTSEDLVIADRDKAVGIAGVFGSAAAEVSPATTEVLLESAHFAPSSILRTSRRLGLQTEASTRFARGADPEAVAPAAARAARLIVEWGGGRVLRGAIDVGAPPKRRRLTVRPARASLLIGNEVTAPDAVEALGRLGIEAEKRDGVVEVEVPSFRPDLQVEADLIEEIARVQGYQRLDSKLPGIRQVGGAPKGYRLRRRIREAMVRGGHREALSLSFASQEDLDLMGNAPAVRVANPPSQDEPFLRTSLLPNLIRALARNASRGVRGAALFEVGHVFRAGGSKEPVLEREAVAAVLNGPAGEGFNADRHEFDVFDAKGSLEGLLAAVGIGDWELRDAPGGPWHPARSASVVVGGQPVGVMGELRPDVVARFDVTGRVAAFEVDAAALAEHLGRGRTFREIPRYPPIHRDLAFVVDADAPARAVERAMREAGGALVDRVVLFDVFEGGPIPEGRKSLAFSVDFRAPDRTLTDEEAERAVLAIVERVVQDFGGELRAG